MHHRQKIRELVFQSLVNVMPATVELSQERARRVPSDATPAVSLKARDEALEPAAGTMGSPDDQRALDLEFSCYTTGATGVAAVDAVNDLDELIGIAVDQALIDDLVVGVKWAGTSIEVDTDDQERFWAVGTITYAAIYQVFYGDPV